VTRGRIAAVLILVLVVIGANAWAHSTTAQVDLSENRRFSLSRESREIAEAVDAPMDVTAFLFQGGGVSRDAEFLLSRYRELNPKIDFRIIDPDEEPAEAKRFRISRYSSVVVDYEGRRVEARSPSEIDLSSAMLAVLRGERKTVCVVVGHGEPALDDTTDDGLSSMRSLLERNAYVVQELDLTRVSEVPAKCRAVALVGPQTGLLPAEEKALLRYARNAGRLMVLATPFTTGDPNPLIEPWGISFAGGLAVDPARTRNLDLSNLVVEEFPSASPVVDGLEDARLNFPAPGGLLVGGEEREGLTVARLAVTSEDGFVETRPEDEIRFSPGDIPGPVVLAAAADDSRVAPTGETRLGEDGPRIVRTRVLVTGNSLWATNQFLDRLGNRLFLLNGLGWLTEEEQVLTVAASISPVRELPWTPERQNRVIGIAVVLVPGAVIGLGLVHRLVARRRERFAR
jgi:ABC-type uncharacterized transport system involved in gliding motility auxiliary subunit